MRSLLAGLALWLIASPPAEAGPEIDHAQLLATADAIALIEHHNDAWRLLRWLREPVERDVELVIHVPCLADAAQLQKWLAGMSRHPGRPYWQAAREASAYTQILYLRLRDGALHAWCETEVLMAEDLSVHPAFAARKAAAMGDSERTCE